MQSREGTLIADVSTPGRSVTLVGFDVGDSNWPLKASFVLFMRNVVELARSHRLRGAEAPARTGEPTACACPVDVSEVELESPERQLAKSSTARDGLCVVPNLSRAGFYFASYRGQDPGQRAVRRQPDQRARERSARPRELPPRAGRPVAVRARASWPTPSTTGPGCSRRSRSA